MKNKRLSEAFQITVTFATGLFLILLLIFPSDVSESVKGAALTVCTVVLPSLFPFMVLSKILFSAVGFKGSSKSRHFSKIFGSIRQDTYLPSVLVGFISGFPVGCSVVCELYKSGRLDRKGAERGLAISHNTGPAFIVNVAGAALWGSGLFGVSLYLNQIISWAIVLLLTRSEGTKPVVQFKKPTESKTGCGIITAITNAVSSSSLSCVNIIGSIVFWKIVLTLISKCLVFLTKSQMIVLTAVTEFSEGCALAATLGGIFGAALTGFAIGFSGICAIFQGASIAAECGLSVRPMLKFKLMQGVICSALTAFSYKILLPTKCAEYASVSLLFSSSPFKLHLTVTIAVIIAFSVIEIFRKPPYSH